MIESEEIEALKHKCKERGWDFDRLVAFANALHLMIVKYRCNKWGARQPYVTCYKSKRVHYKQSENYRENF